MASIDLFSGIGGLTLALQGVARPIAYCEIDPAAQAVLQFNMQKERLPKAPIHADITDFVPRRRVNYVVAGFPCIGFSAAGKREGFQQEQTALFFEMLRVIDLAKPRVVFMENVNEILNSGIQTVNHEFTKRRYNLRWCVMPASNVGAPHRRLRWYCVAYRSMKDLPRATKFKLDAYDWSREPQRMVLASKSENIQRHRLLGNAVVPYAAMHAFRHLCSITESSAKDTANASVCYKNPHHFHPIPAPDPVTQAPVLNLTIDPRVFRSSIPKAPSLTSELLKTAVTKKLWSTPTANTLSPSNYLTVRSDHTLHTQVRFESSTPNHLRKGRVSPRFVEYLMGYPIGWTSLRCQRP